MTLGVFVDTFVYGVIIPFLPTIVGKFGGDSKDSGLLLAYYSIGLLVATPIIAIISDRYQRRKLFMIIVLACLIGSTIAFGLAESYWLLAVGRILQGASSGGVWTLGMSIIVVRFNANELGQAMGIVLAGYTAGGLLGPPLGGILYERLGYQAPFIFSGALALLDLFGLLLLEEAAVVNESRGVTQQSKQGETDRDLDSSAARKAPTNMLQVLIVPSIVIVNVLTILTGTVLASIEATLPLRLKDHYGFNVETIGLAFMAIQVPSTMFSPIAGWVYDRYGFRPILTGSLIACAAIAPLLGIEQGFATLVVVIVVFAIAFTFGLSPALAEVAACVPKAMISQSYAIFNMSFSVGLLLGPICGSLMYQYVGWLWEWVLIASLLFIAIPLPLIFKRPVYID
ncbi:major facilitator superfamily domain-containing protein [Entophlyctis helioformis]|nr:major facilitator superfamily domain-containing protein [Entophlyctis helioformis]